MQVWIMERGEDHEGSDILGVYAEKAIAYGHFAHEAEDLNDRFTGSPIDDAELGENGSLYLHAGCDYLTLAPYDVATSGPSRNHAELAQKPAGSDR